MGPLILDLGLHLQWRSEMEGAGWGLRETQVGDPRPENDDETPLQFQHFERTPRELAVVVFLRTEVIKKCRSGFLRKCRQDIWCLRGRAHM